MSDSVRIDLTPIVRSIDQMGQQLSSQVSDVGYKVGTVANDLTVTRSELEQLKADFEAFVRTHERTRLVQLAETRLGTLKSDLEREYGHYGLVRRTSVGILQAFDIGNVRNQTVHGLSEELMIQTPKYWLAPALVALAAWSKDDEELARKSVEAAFSRDPKKTSLFFALTLRRQARLPEATRWLRHYFVSLDPRALSREFAVLLEAVAQDGFGAEGRQLVVEHLAQWRDILRDEPEIVSAQVHKWRGEILNHRGTVDDSTFSFLAHGSPDWPQVKEALEHSSAHEFVIGKYTGVRDTVTGLTASVADRLDDLLEILVSEFDEDELPLRRELIFQEAIIEHDGDADRARAAAELDVVALDERIDALSLQTHTAFRPDLFGVSAATQQIAVGSSAEDFLSAIGQFSRDYRSTWPDVIEIVLDESHSSHATTYGFGQWKTPSSASQADAETSLNEHWDNTMQRYIDAETFSVRKVVGPILGGVGGLVVGVLALAGGAVVLGALIALLALGASTALVLRKRSACERAVTNAENLRDTAKTVSIDAYRGVSAEWVDARLVYEEEDAKEADLLELIEGWPH